MKNFDSKVSTLVSLKGSLPILSNGLKWNSDGLRIKAEINIIIQNLFKNTQSMLLELEHFRTHDLKAYREWHSWTFEREYSGALWNSHWSKPYSELDSFSAKSIYRNIVRMLHPDLNKTSIDVKIWAELQKQYKNGDVEALLEMKERLIYEQRLLYWKTISAESELQNLVDNLKVSVDFLKLATDRMKESYAWGFLKRKSLRSLKRRIKEQIDASNSSLVSESSQPNSIPVDDSYHQMSLF